LTAIDVAAVPPLSHGEAMRLQAAELQRTIALLRSLDDADWTAATDCAGWDVRAMYQHVLGASEAGASMRENLHQLRRGRAHRKSHGGPLEAALSSVQVEERSELEPVQILAAMVAVAPKTVRGRNRSPFILELTGPAGGTYASGPAPVDAERLSLDAVDFCRALAGRAAAPGLLSTVVPF